MPTDTSSPHWRPATRVAFRFAVVYFGLYVLLTQMLGSLIPIPIGDGLPELGPKIQGWVVWTGAHLFHVNASWVLSGSGDKLFDWVQVFCLLVAAALATLVWTVLDRGRERYDRLYRWFRVFARFALGSTLVTYGVAKAIPLQMPAPPPSRLIEPFGNFSPMGVLWYSVGASFPYEVIVGCAELVAGVLLFIPRTALAGALVALADMVMVFILNMTYDVPVKLFSFHMVVLSLILIAPDAKRLVAQICSAGARTRPAAVAQVAFGAYIVAIGLYGSAQAWHTYGGGVPTPAIYGIWDVDAMTIDGVSHAPLLSDPERWRRIVVDRATSITFVRLDDTLARYRMQLDTEKNAIVLSAADKNWSAHFSLTRPSPAHLVLDGSMGGHAVHMETTRYDPSRFNLVSRGFHWVQQYPVNQ
jgi:hypothetical protein